MVAVEQREPRHVADERDRLGLELREHAALAGVREDLVLVRRGRIGQQPAQSLDAVARERRVDRRVIE